MLKFLHSQSGKILISILWGFGLACLFRKVCRGRNCIIYNAPDPNEIKKIFGEDLFIVEGTLGKLNKPTPVQDLETGKWIRK